MPRSGHQDGEPGRFKNLPGTQRPPDAPTWGIWHLVGFGHRFPTLLPAKTEEERQRIEEAKAAERLRKAEAKEAKRKADEAKRLGYSPEGKNPISVGDADRKWEAEKEEREDRGGGWGGSGSGIEQG